ncbi:hypothetical protein [Actinophytocola glycyrrhizae]|uniref:Uncharacterized protein n=1 Tax=Actinophytocola glycyrrhizae TaxID=2044873 RepID=A0ABV9RSE1_9PSEU
MAGHEGAPDDISARLQSMRALHFEFATDHGADGGIEALVGVRVHHGVIDIFELYGEDEATATRLPDSEPNIMLASTVLWQTRGTAYEVIDELLALPDPDGDGELPTPLARARARVRATARRGGTR